MNEREESQETQSNVFGDDYSTEKAKDSRKTTRRLFRNLMEQKWKLLLVLVSTIAASAFGLLSPKVMGTAINHIWDGIQSAMQSGGRFRVNFETMGSPCRRAGFLTRREAPSAA